MVILIARFKLHPLLGPDSGRHPGWNPVAGFRSHREQEIKPELESATRDLKRQLSEGAISQQDFVRRREEIGWQLQEEWLQKQGKSGGQLVLALEMSAQEFGRTAGAIGLVIVLQPLLASA